METKIANNNMEYKEYTVVAPPSFDYYHGLEWNFNLDIFHKLEHSPMVQLIYFNRVIKPYIIHSIIETILSWNQQSHDYNYTYT